MQYPTRMICTVEDWIAKEAIKWRNERRIAHIDRIVERVTNRDNQHGTDTDYQAGFLDGRKGGGSVAAGEATFHRDVELR